MKMMVRLHLPVAEWVQLVPVGYQGPHDAHEQDLMSPAGEGASMQEKGQVRADHHHEALSEVPVPWVRPVKLSHVMQYVKLQEVPLDKSPLWEENRCYGTVYFHNK